MTMNDIGTSTGIRAGALGAAGVIATALFATIVANMPPADLSAPNDARNGATTDGYTPVAIVPARIEVIGARVEETAASQPRIDGGAPRT
jgi:hypothetical protein